MAPEFAARCQFQNPHQHKAHGKRALGITMLFNSSVSEQMKFRALRHSNRKSHARYQRINDEIIKKKYEAMNLSLLNDSSRHATGTDQLHPTIPSPQQKQTNPFTPSSTIPSERNKQNIGTPSFDQNHSPQPPNQVFINIFKLLPCVSVLCSKWCDFLSSSLFSFHHKKGIRSSEDYFVKN